MKAKKCISHCQLTCNNIVQIIKKVCKSLIINQKPCPVIQLADAPSVERTSCNTVKMLLKFDGHDVEAANSNEEALGLFESGQFDLVFTDFTMPGMNGNQLAAAIKAGAPDQPVVMITAHAGTLPPSPDVDFVVGKPFRLEHLREVIAKVLPVESRVG